MTHTKTIKEIINELIKFKEFTSIVGYHLYPVYPQNIVLGEKELNFLCKDEHLKDDFKRYLLRYDGESSFPSKIKKIKEEVESYGFEYEELFQGTFDFAENIDEKIRNLGEVCLNLPDFIFDIFNELILTEFKNDSIDINEIKQNAKILKEKVKQKIKKTEKEANFLLTNI